MNAGSRITIRRKSGLSGWRDCAESRVPARRKLLLELLDLICVSTNEVGGLLKRGGVLGFGSGAALLILQEQAQAAGAGLR